MFLFNLFNYCCIVTIYMYVSKLVEAVGVLLSINRLKFLYLPTSVDEATKHPVRIQIHQGYCLERS